MALASSRKKPRRDSDGHILSNILSAKDLQHQQQQYARLVDASPSSDQTSKKYWQDKYYQLSRDAAQAFLAQATQQGLTRRRGGNTWCILNQYQPGEDLPPHWYNFESDRVYEDSLRFNSALALLELAEDEGQEVAGLSAKVFDDNTVQILLVYHFLPSGQNLGKVGGALGSDGNKLSKNGTAYHTILAMAISLSSIYGYDMIEAVVLVYQMVGWVDALQISGDHDMASKKKKKTEYDRLWKLAHKKSIAFCGESVKKFNNLCVIIPIGEVAYKVVKQYPRIFPQDKLLPIQDRSLAHPSSFVLSKGATDEQSELWLDVLNHAFAACMGIKPKEDLPSWLPGALFYPMIKETKEKKKKTLADKKARGDMSTVNAARLAGTVGKWDAMIQRAKDGAEGEILYHAKCDKDGCTNEEGRPIKFHVKEKTIRKKKYYYPRLYSKCNCHSNQHDKWLPLFKLPHGKEEVWDGYKLDIASPDNPYCDHCEGKVACGKWTNNYMQTCFSCEDCEKNLKEGNIYDSLIVNKCDCGKRHYVSVNTYAVKCTDCHKRYLVASDAVCVPFDCKSIPTDWCCYDCRELKADNETEDS